MTRNVYSVLILSVVLCFVAAARSEDNAAQSPAFLVGNAPVATQPAPSLAGPRNKNNPARRASRADRRAMKDRATSQPSDSDSDTLTDEQIDRLMTFLQRNFPVMHDRLARMRERDPANFKRLIHRAARTMFPMVRLAAENPELGEKMIAEHKAQLKVQELRDRYARTREPEKAAIREELRQQVDIAFEARMDRLRFEVKQLQKRLDQAKDNLANQEKNKQQMIQDRLADLLSQAPPQP